MKTVSSIVEIIGTQRLTEMLGVAEQSIYRCEKTNLFTALWYRAIVEELSDLGYPMPSMDLFGFREHMVPRRTS